MDFVELCTLQKKIGYYFNQPSFLLRALTHKSYSSKNNERLEFLGDAILNYIITSFLYTKYSTLSEGVMSRIRANLVCTNTLAELAKEFNLGNYIKLGPGELKNGGYKRYSILSNTIEALIGSIFLDSNMQTIELLIYHWYKIRLNYYNIQDIKKDPKTQLQEYLQSNGLPLPVYQINNIKGKDHDQIFVVKCQIAKLNYSVIGYGLSKQKAEQDAAKIALQKLIKINKN